MTNKTFSKRPPVLLQVVVWYTLLMAVGGGAWQTVQALQPAPTYTLTAIKRSAALAPSNFVIGGIPTHISIPSRQIDLDILPGSFDSVSGDWVLSPNQPHFATETTKPNNWRGTTVIYGHNNTHVFGPTKCLTTGDSLRLTTTSGRIFVYSFTGSELVDPSQTAILTVQTGAPSLVLITCDGIWNEHRRLMHFELREIQ